MHDVDTVSGNGDGLTAGVDDALAVGDRDGGVVLDVVTDSLPEPDRAPDGDTVSVVDGVSVTDGDCDGDSDGDGVGERDEHAVLPGLEYCPAPHEPLQLAVANPAVSP